LYDAFHRWDELFLASHRTSPPDRFDDQEEASDNASEERTASTLEQWLRSACASHIAAIAEAELMSPEQLAKEIRDICADEKNQDSLQIRLFDLIGENGFDLICEIISKADVIARISEKEMTSHNQLLPISSETSQELTAPKPHSGNFIVQTESEKALRAQVKKKEQQRSQGKRDERSQTPCEGTDAQTDWLRMAGFSEEYLNEERMLGLQSNRKFQDEAYAANNPWLQSLIAGGNRVVHDRVGLPEGTTRKFASGTEEVFIPAPAKPLAVPNDLLVQITALEDWAQLAFADTKRLNRIQSAVFETAYNSAENMLVCAPTGAGKTNIAMLTLLQQMKMRMVDGRFDRNSLKAVYIAPMKALAQEVVTKFSVRLKPLGLVVKEFTGDMQLTRQEIADSNLIVSTPEKWDVVTRKGGDGSLGTMISLIIIDEIHLLADERGAVLETIVARTQRYVESSQKLIRLVGLSATLPNYRDVASFLGVNQSTGMFFFGPEYRPVPLDMTFVGVTEKAKPRRDEQMNRSAYEKMVEALKKGKQVMIFVHSRKDTSKTIEAVTDLCAKYNTLSLLDNFDHEQYSMMKKKVDKNGGMELQKLFARGCGVHHAGMQRSDRSLTEQLFEMGLIKVEIINS
jgi:activating signal cointegrator complex subunit 3